MTEHAHAAIVSRSPYKRGLLIALAITTTIMVAEAIGGIVSNSLALLGDAGHMLTDSMALGHTTLQLECESCESSPVCDLGELRKESQTAES